MRLATLLIAVCALGLPGAAAAQRTPVLVELFTSQGCSSCPPADAIFAELASQPGVIALSLHVDYWDYLGWKDSFGHAAFTERQQSYAKAARERSVYTPQMIVQGADRVVGADEAHVVALVAAHQGRPARVTMALESDGATLRVALEPLDPGGVGPVDVFVVRYSPEETVEIAEGENAGHTITYTNVVTEWRAVGRWDGQTPAVLSVPVPGSDPVAVIAQAERFGPVLSAAMLP